MLMLLLMMMVILMMMLMLMPILLVLMLIIMLKLVIMLELMLIILLMLVLILVRMLMLKPMLMLMLMRRLVGATSCPSERLAVYKLELETFWDERNFPKQYPQVDKGGLQKLLSRFCPLRGGKPPFR